ncbi:MAG: metallophosphoesterase [Treponema sp.]|nr:metallophosphoesterase [Treponema sp.]
MIFFTDFHERYNARNSVYIIKRILTNFPASKIFFGGDAITLSEQNKKKALKVHKKFYDCFSFCADDFFFIYGNHDNNSHAQKNKNAILETNEVKNVYFKKQPCIFFGEFSYYLDDVKSQTRYVCLDTGKQYITKDEMQKITATLNSASEGFHIIILTHIVYEFIERKYQPRQYIVDMLNIFDAFNKLNSKTRVECIIGGHIHNDYVSSTSGGIPIILCDSDSYLFSANRFVRKRRHVSEQCITVFFPDYEKGVLNLFRFGYGKDLQIPLK